ncbi:serine hydrolase domain-containing protein [Kordiimonas lacus]|uniref:CubicO group peptidase, beta-lactamase class C family n=1 Tax=Kordiimonas lacus TaxID=637679 RepID=A0A1G6YIP5_9PROT|nr:serine hydrolase domain-containing protein [Kordiimonas lacus]SDD90259.1 CubicO group peptidase, beta-lactamase class C family [Kordiimonas lacus]
MRLSAIHQCLVGLILMLGATSQVTPQDTLVARQQSLDALLADKAAAHGIVGQSVAVLKNGELVATATHGQASVELSVPVGEDTVFQMFSVAKLFVNTVMMQLMEAGDVQMDAPVATYLPNLPSQWQKTTVRQLLTHTSGLPDYYHWPNPTPENEDTAIALAAKGEFVFTPNTDYRYNQTNYLLLKQIIETITGQSFSEVMQGRMMDPAGLTQTRYGGEYAVVPNRARTYFAGENGLLLNGPIFQPDYMFASTGLNSSAPDMVLWTKALLDGKFLPPERLQHYWQTQDLANGKLGGFAAGWEYWETESFRIVGHGGGNRVDVRHFISKTSGDTISVIYLTNGASTNFWPGSISTAIAERWMPGVSSWLN